MKHSKIISILLIGITILSTISPSIVAQESDDLNLLEKALIMFFEQTYSLGPMVVPWGVMRLSEPIAFNAEPNVIDIQYMGKAEIIIGVKDLETGEYKQLKDFAPPPLFPVEEYVFSLDLPDNVPEGALIARFSPQSLVVSSFETLEGQMKTKLSIVSNIPKDATLPKDITVRVNISKYSTGANLYLPPKQVRNPISNFLWFLSATGITFPFPFGSYYSGKRTLDEESIMYVDLVLRVDRFHLAEITPPQQIEIEPNQLTYVPIEIKNLGSHIDTFSFTINTSIDNELVVSPPDSITLEPGEVGHTSIGIASPLSFRDPGTAHSIHIEAYSIYEPDRLFDNTLVIITRGMYVSEMNTFYFAFFGIIILLGAMLFFYRRRKILQKLCIKPDEPWELEKEKKYLDKLEEKDKEKYDETMKMMKDEYKSSLLWYKHYCKDMLKESKEIAAKASSPTSKKSDKPDEIKQKTKPKELEHKPKKQEKTKNETEQQVVKEDVPKKQEKPEQKNDETSELEKQKRNQAILKIKKAQEKQRKKLKL